MCAWADSTKGCTKDRGASAASETTLWPGNRPLFPQWSSTHARRRHHHVASDLLEHLHDVCLVCPPSRPARETVAGCGRRQLGHRVLRVPASGARQSHWLQRSSVVPTEDS